MTDLTPIPGFPGYFIRQQDGAVFSNRGSRGREVRRLKTVQMGTTGHKLSPAVKLMLGGAPFAKTIRQLMRITFGDDQ